MMHSVGYNGGVSSHLSPLLPITERSVVVTEVPNTRPRGLSDTPAENVWLLSECVSDPTDRSLTTCVCVAVDCVRIRLVKSEKSQDLARRARENLFYYERLMNDRLAQAAMIKELGFDLAKARMRELQDYGSSSEDKVCSVIYRFTALIDRVCEYFRVRRMRMEPFQLELFRGVVLGIAGNQFGDTLFKYKHTLLDKLGVAPLGSENFDYASPTLSHYNEIERMYTRYANPYTLCLAPRQCGKSMIMKLVLASVLLHLDINVMVQAQNKHMCTTLRLGVESAMCDIQNLPSFREVEKPINIRGNPENRIYEFKTGYKGSSVAHFLSSSNDVSILAL